MTVFLGVLSLIWLSSESVHMVLVAVLGAAWAFAIVGHITMQQLAERQFEGYSAFIIAIIFGGLVGVLAVFMSILLMIFKNVQHAHLIPDFPSETIADMLPLVPAWGLAGALLAMAYLFYQQAKTVQDGES